MNYFSLPQGDKPLKKAGRYPLSTTLRAPQTLGLEAKPLETNQDQVIGAIFSALERTKSERANTDADQTPSGSNLPLIAALLSKRYNENNQKGGSPWQAVDLHRS